MTRTRVKICGVTSPRDAATAVAAGADAVGLVFYNASPRYVTLAQAEEICRAVPAFVSVVALSVDMPAQELEQLLEHLPISVLQFHGNETPEHCQRFNKPFIKALRVKPDMDVAGEVARYQAANGILLDAYRKGVPGGTGEQFDWALIPAASRSSIILAGGLNPDNVSRAITEVRPYAVDVSGGVEQSPGVKDAAKVQAFLRQVANADRERRDQ